MRLIDADALIDTFKEQQKMKWNQCASPSSWSDAYDDFIDALQMSETVGEWISVDDRLPDARNDEYLVAVETKHDREHYTTTDHWVSQLQHWYIYDEKSEAVVTHWMPFPEPPKGESDD